MTHGYYSRLQADLLGSFYHETPQGEIVSITTLTDYPETTMLPDDAVYMGIVYKKTLGRNEYPVEPF